MKNPILKITFRNGSTYNFFDTGYKDDINFIEKIRFSFKNDSLIIKLNLADNDGNKMCSKIKFNIDSVQSIALTNIDIDDKVYFNNALFEYHPREFYIFRNSYEHSSTFSITVHHSCNPITDTYVCHTSRQYKTEEIKITYISHNFDEDEQP